MEGVDGCKSARRLYGRREEIIIARVIEEAALGRAVDSVPRNAGPSRRARVVSEASGPASAARQAREAVGVAGDGRRQVVVDLTGDANAVWAGQEIRAGTAVREHLHGIPPASSIDFSRRSPISGMLSSGFGPFAGGFFGRKPRG